MPIPLKNWVRNRPTNSPLPQYSNFYFPLNSNVNSYYSNYDRKGSFTRESISYNQSGTQIASGLPRYETALCDQGIMIEEGTTNVFLNSDVPVTQSIAVTTANSGKWTTTVRGAGTVTTSAGTATATGYGEASDGSPNTITVTGNGTVVFTVAGADATTKVQVENKAYGTSHMVTEGTSATRAAETLTIPTAGVFTKGSWTIEQCFKPMGTQVRANAYKRLWQIFIDANNYYNLVIGSDGKAYLETYSGGVPKSIYWTSQVLAVDTWYAFGCKGDGVNLTFFANGTKIGQVAYTEPVGTLPVNIINIGNSNGLTDDLCISSIARSDADMAIRGASSVPHSWDKYTTYLQGFDGNLIAKKRRHPNL